MKYQGSCHCGKIRFEVEGKIDGAISCNCSLCSRKGSLLWAVQRSQLHLRTPENAAGTYTFNKHSIRHRFCPNCGIQPYSEGVDREGNRMAVINIRCLEGVDLSEIPVQEFDGKAI
ncbi:MAG: GFA family protein [Steroidobacteraceae bacterium]